MRTPTEVAHVLRAASVCTALVCTPLLECPLLNAQLGGRLLLKAESLQQTGSFKFRGALNRVLNLSDEERQRVGGVVAFSSGNFGQALAAAATSQGVPCTIVSMHDAPAAKLARIRGFGADLVLSTAAPGQNREVAAAQLAVETAERLDAVLLHPFDDWHVIHGQGTLGVELARQVDELAGDATLDALVVPTGGGGLAAGTCLALSSLSPRTEVFTVEPSGFDDHARCLNAAPRPEVPRSLAELYPQGPPPTASKLCDALMAGAPGALTWRVTREHVAGGLVADDASVARAMHVALEHFKLVLEPSGALALAAVLDGQVPTEGKVVGVVASGGNADARAFAQALGCTQE